MTITLSLSDIASIEIVSGIRVGELSQEAKIVTGEDCANGVCSIN
jgi:hypothetical protein